MRKMIIFNMISADGYFEGVDHDLDWHNVNAEFNDFAIAQLDEADTLVFGRKTYELMASFWPTAMARKNDPDVAEKMNSTAKVVLSHSLNVVEWHNTTLLKDNAIDRLRELKEGHGKALLVLGSSNLCVGLLEEGLIDEVRLMVNPIVLGKGNTIFAGLNKPLRLELTDTHKFKSGNILLSYSVPDQQKE
jgi:dihydrofolate reductase